MIDSFNRFRYILFFDDESDAFCIDRCVTNWGMICLIGVGMNCFDDESDEFYWIHGVGG